MFKYFFAQLVLRIRLGRYVRMQRAIKQLEATLALKQRFPEHKRYDIGGIEILRFDAAGGVDIKAIAKDIPVTLEPQLYSLQLDTSLVPDEILSAYAKPRIEKVKVTVA